MDGWCADGWMYGWMGGLLMDCWFHFCEEKKKLPS
jgi:hypothetical protein